MDRFVLDEYDPDLGDARLELWCQPEGEIMWQRLVDYDGEPCGPDVWNSVGYSALENPVEISAATGAALHVWAIHNWQINGEVYHDGGQLLAETRWQEYAERVLEISNEG